MINLNLSNFVNLKDIKLVKKDIAKTEKNKNVIEKVLYQNHIQNM